MNLDAPILPGQGAGGILLGSSIAAVTRMSNDYFKLKPWPAPTRPLPDWYIRLMPPSSSPTVYTSAAIDLWASDGVIYQISVHHGYRTKLQGAVGIGSTLGDLEDQLGTWEENEPEVYDIVGLPGVCFDVEEGDCPACLRDRGQPYRHLLVTIFYVSQPHS